MALPGTYSDFSGIRINGVPLDPHAVSSARPRPVVQNSLSKTLYVRSIGADGGSVLFGDGSTPDLPLATLAAALTALAGRQNKGDIIYVLPGHVESISAADYFSGTGAASYISIRGVGNGTNLPTFNWTAAASTWLLDTAGMELFNLRLNLCGSSAATTITVVTPITISAANCRIISCEINWGLDTNTGCGSTLGAIAGVAATNLDIIGNRCINLDTAGTLAVSCFSLDGCDNLRMVGNHIAGGTTSTTVGAVHFVTTASLNVLAESNYVENLVASSTKAFSSAIAGVTGVVRYNQFAVNAGIVGVTASSNLSCRFYQNFTSDTLNQNGALDVAGGTST